MKKPYTILSVGGSIIAPKDGFNISFLKQFVAFIKKRVANGERFILIIGGGNTAREYQAAAKKVDGLTNTELDWVGIEATRMNAVFIRFLLKSVAHKEIVTDPRKKVRTKKPVIVAAGWKPGHSTDVVAVGFAQTYGASHVLNLSNITSVYTKDPQKYKSAKKIDAIDWKRFRKDIVGNTWIPGKSAPFDPIASRKAQQLKLRVSIVNGTNLTAVAHAIDEKKFTGTVIHP